MFLQSIVISRRETSADRKKMRTTLPHPMDVQSALVLVSCDDRQTVTDSAHNNSGSLLTTGREQRAEDNGKKNYVIICKPLVSHHD